MIPVVVLFLAVVFHSVTSQTCQNPAGIGPCLGGQCPQGAGPATCLNGAVCCLNTQIVTTTTTTTAPCVDLLNPSTGVSDCPKDAYLCNNSVYFTLMTQQCPKTCNRCPGTNTGNTGNNNNNANCVDLLNPATGVSDCPNRANLCNNSIYFTLMTQQCPKTCNRCPASK